MGYPPHSITNNRRIIMALVQTNWTDQWIAENYPNAMFLVEQATGEVVICLGENENGEIAY